MNNQLTEVGAGSSALSETDESGKRLPDIAIRVMRKMIAAHELQEGCDLGSVYMSHAAQLDMWREVYEAYAALRSVHVDPCGQVILRSLSYLLSVWGTVDDRAWKIQWAEAVRRARLYMARYGGRK
jgi:hypothetical protein